MAYWLFKSEPESFSIDDLRTAKTTIWDGIRNYQARNYLLTAAKGDLVFFYHSNAKPPGIVGLAKVTHLNVVDPTQFDESSHYYDATSKPSEPRWMTVKVGFVEKFRNELSLDLLKETFDPAELMVIRKGMRLSVTPVPDKVAAQILEMGREKR